MRTPSRRREWAWSEVNEWVRGHPTVARSDVKWSEVSEAVMIRAGVNWASSVLDNPAKSLERFRALDVRICYGKLDN